MKRVTIIGKRPATATREAGLKLREDGYTYQQIADMWHITRSRVHQILNPIEKVRAAMSKPSVTP